MGFLVAIVSWGWPVLASESVNPQPIPETPQEYLREIAGTNYNVLDRIATCESNWRTNAKNPNSSASGVFQFLSSTWNKWGQGDVFNPYDNIRSAVKLFDAEGTTPWLASKKCWGN